MNYSRFLIRSLNRINRQTDSRPLNRPATDFFLPTQRERERERESFLLPLSLSLPFRSPKFCLARPSSLLASMSTRLRSQNRLSAAVITMRNNRTVQNRFVHHVRQPSFPFASTSFFFFFFFFFFCFFLFLFFIHVFVGDRDGVGYSKFIMFWIFEVFNFTIWRSLKL